jgi:hypothetical protein
MKRNVAVWMVVCVGVLLACSLASAHHGTSAYDMTRTVTLKGTITKFDFANPHSQVYFDVKDDQGKVAHWVCESLPPGRAIRAGWRKDSLKPGDQVTVTCNPAKNGAPVGFLQEVVLSDGKVLTIKAPE